MKILQINSVCGVTGTGRIVTDLYDTAVSRGHDCVIAYGEHKFHNDPGNRKTIEIGSMQDCRLHAVATRLWDAQGFASKKATKEFLRNVDEYEPDVVHLHNLHGYYMNVELLFRYLKQKKVKVVWTLHDCWPYTGHCVYYQGAGCDKWKTMCHDCPLTKQYPGSLGIDRSQANFRRKQELFTGMEDMIVLVPSHWLEIQVRESFLHEYPIRIVYNGIDLDTFHPTESNFRKKYGLEDKFIVLGAANVWEERKGLATFLRLSERLGEDAQIVLVGLSKEQIEALPERILGLSRTDTPGELAEIYTAADVFVTPGREETFGLTVAEAMACGTWPIVYADTACAEVVEQGKGQIVTGDLPELEATIRECRNRGIPEKPTEIAAAAACFSKHRFGREVMDIYEEKA